MKEFIMENWLTIIILLAALAYITVLVVKGKWEDLRKLAYAAMMSAERLFADGQGKEKMEAVFQQVYDMIPAWLQRFIPPESIKEKLQEWYDLAKDWLIDGVIDNKYPG
jgi:hypothetical protein